MKLSSSPPPQAGSSESRTVVTALTDQGDGPIRAPTLSLTPIT